MKDPTDKNDAVGTPGAEAFSCNTAERHILVHEAGASSSGYVPDIFPLSSVERVVGYNDKNSFIVLRSGHKIFVTLPCAELHRKIHAPDFKTDDLKLLDLSPFTGAAAEEGLPKTIGTSMPDGTVYAGISPDGKRMYVTPRDASLQMSFERAARYVQSLNATRTHGHTDWRLPSMEELKLLYDTKGEGFLRNTFNESGQDYAGHYRSSQEHKTSKDCANSVNFRDGSGGSYYKSREMSVRCVRTEENF